MKKLTVFLLLFVSAEYCFAQWEPDVRLTDNPSNSNNYSKEGIASSGDSVHVVWYDDRDGNNEIYYKRSVDGGQNWGEDIRLTNTSYNSLNVSVAIDGFNVYALWSEDLDGNFETFFKRSSDGGDTWEEDTRLTFTPGVTSGTSIAVSGSLLHVVYYDNSDGWWEVYYKQSTDGGSTWEPEVRLTFDPSLSANTSVCCSGSLVHVVWDDQRDGYRTIYYKRSEDEGITWGEDTRITNYFSVSWVPCVRTTGADVYIVWVDQRDEDNEIYFKHSPDDGLTWGEDIRLTNYVGNSLFPNLAVCGNGIFTVWQDDRIGIQEIFYKYSLDGGDSWQPDTRLTYDPAESKYPFISLSGTQVNVAWTDFLDGNYEIYYKRDPNGNPLAGVGERRAEGIELSVYPNPAGRQLTVDSWPSAVGSRRSAVRLSIVDLFGRVVKEFGEISSFPHQIDISGLPDGVYLLKMIDDSGNVSSAKFLKINE